MATYARQLPHHRRGLWCAMNKLNALGLPVNYPLGWGSCGLMADLAPPPLHPLRGDTLIVHFKYAMKVSHAAIPCHISWRLCSIF